MNEFDKFCNTLLEESKRFFEKARSSKSNEEQAAFIHASLLLVISSIEAFVNGITDDFADSNKFSLLEKSLLLEKEVSFTKGTFDLNDKLKISRLNDKIELLYKKFKNNPIDKFSSGWWAELQAGIHLRNQLVHPKESVIISISQLENTIKAVIKCIDELFKMIYKKGYPDLSLGIDSKYNF